MFSGDNNTSSVD